MTWNTCRSRQPEMTALQFLDQLLKEIYSLVRSHHFSHVYHSMAASYHFSEAKQLWREQKGGSSDIIVTSNEEGLALQCQKSGRLPQVVKQPSSIMPPRLLIDLTKPASASPSLRPRLTSWDPIARLQLKTVQGWSHLNCLAIPLFLPGFWIGG